MTDEPATTPADERARVKALAAGQPEWGTWGSATQHARYSVPTPPTSRRRCRCGCGKRATHAGSVNGLAMATGCELSIARWVKGEPTPPAANWWRCPNDPPCPHGSILHDVYEYRGDGTDTCCAEGCDCRGPEAKR